MNDAENAIPDPDREYKDREKKVADALQVLTEFFDGVQILATYCDAGGTRSICDGIGNVHARVNMCREYAMVMDEETMEKARLNVRSDDSQD